MPRITFQQGECSISEGLKWEGKRAVANPEIRRRPVNHNSVARLAW
jgi:hypothetical protein